MDVVNNIKLHGYTPVFYPLDDHFQIQKSEFEKWRNRYKPSVIILFHACGIRNILTSDKKFIRTISKNTLVIEDSVHLLINPESVKTVHENHVIIDSLRKTSPLNGSFIYSKTRIPYSSKHPEIPYRLFTHTLYQLFRITLQMGTILKSPAIIAYAHKTLLKSHDDMIGDNTEGHPGNPFTSWLHSFIQFSKIEQLKTKQSHWYSKNLSPLFHSKSPFYSIRVSKSIYKYLHVFPVGLKKTSGYTPEKLEKYLASLGFPVWVKFPDCPWSSTRSVLFLPLGFHVGYNEIRQISDALTEFAHTIYVS